MSARTEIPKKERILEAAEKVFSSHGYEKATMDEIMNLADVGKGTIYKYYGNKEQLFFKLVEAKNKLFVRELQKRTNQDKDLKEKMVGFFDVMITFYRKNTALWQIICFEMLGGSNGCLVSLVDGKAQVISRYDMEPSEKMKEQLLRYYALLQSEFSILQGIIEEGVKQGELKPMAVEQSTLFVFFGVAMCIFHPHAATEGMSSLAGAKDAVDRFLYGAKL